VAPSPSPTPGPSLKPTPKPTPRPTVTKIVPVPVPPAGTALIVMIATINGKQVLVEGNGSALYIFTADTAGTSTCLDTCTTTWPPLIGPATAGTGIDGTQLGTSQRPDGSQQVTYFGHPLYTFAGDRQPDHADGEGIGGTWFLVDATGNPVQ
jgi:predicted lipoprotein with Yx(FWY)xxD motif